MKDILTAKLREDGQAIQVSAQDSNEAEGVSAEAEDAAPSAAAAEAAVEAKPANEAAVEATPANEAAFEAKPPCEAAVEVKPACEADVEVKLACEADVEAKPACEAAAEAKPANEAAVEGSTHSSLEPLGSPADTTPTLDLHPVGEQAWRPACIYGQTLTLSLLFFQVPAAESAAKGTGPTSGEQQQESDISVPPPPVQDAIPEPVEAQGSELQESSLGPGFGALKDLKQMADAVEPEHGEQKQEHQLVL